MTDLRTAAQQALEALEDARTFTGAWRTSAKAITALRAALAQQAEPVEPVPAAVVATQSDVWRGYNGQWAPPGEPIKMVQMLRDLPTGTLLYTAPPQRKPLTEEVAALIAQRDALLEAYRKMKNVAAGYSNLCDDSAFTRKLEREFEAADAIARAAIKAVEEGK